MTRSRLVHLFRWLLVAFLAGLSATALLQPGYVSHWLGTASALLALFAGWRAVGGALAAPVLDRKVPGVRWTWAELLKGVGPPLLLILLAVALMLPLLGGEMPVSHDHPVHLYKAWHFWEKMLTQGRLRGWSSYWFFGYPAEELYPIGSDLWVALFRALTFGTLSWEATYGLSVLGVFAFSALTVYGFGKRLLGPGAGFVAAVLWLLDPGVYREGGWSYTMDWGVWVQVLAMGFALWSVAAVLDVLDSGRPREYARAGLLLAAALLSHPMNVVVLGLTLPLLLIARSLLDRRPLGREGVKAGAALALGVALAGFWFLPMLARSGWTNNMGDLWRSADSVAEGFMDGTLFGALWPFVVFMGALGAAIGLARRQSYAAFLVLFGLLTLFTATSTAFQELDLLGLSKSFGKIQYQRFAIPAKAALFVLAGYALSWLVGTLRRTQASEGRDAEPATGATGKQGPGPGNPLRLWGLALLTALLLAPFLGPGFSYVLKKHMPGVAAIQTASDIKEWADYRSFLEWSAKERAASSEFYRIALEVPRHDHLFMGAPVANDTPLYRTGFTPAKLYVHAPEHSSNELYEKLSVKYVLSRGPVRGLAVKEKARFGRLRVYEFQRYSPVRQTLEGPGRVEAELFEEEHVRLRLSGTSPESKLTLHVSEYPRWVARMNGQRVQVTPVKPDRQSPAMLMQVPVEDGELTFDYERTGVDLMGLLATLAGFLAVVTLFLAGRIRKLAAWWVRWFGLPVRGVLAISGILAGLAGLAVLMVLGFHLSHLGVAALPEGSVGRLLPEASVQLAGKPCERQVGEKRFCSDKDWNYVGPSVQRFDGIFHHCIWAHPSDGGPLEIEFPEVTLGSGLHGVHGIADSGISANGRGAPVTMEIQLDGVPWTTIEKRDVAGLEEFSLDTRGREGEKVRVTLRITTSRAGGRHYCFDLAVVGE